MRKASTPVRAPPFADSLNMSFFFRRSRPNARLSANPLNYRMFGHSARYGALQVFVAAWCNSAPRRKYP
jgi:hypothetical protein